MLLQNLRDLASEYKANKGRKTIIALAAMMAELADSNTKILALPAGSAIAVQLQAEYDAIVNDKEINEIITIINSRGPALKAQAEVDLLALRAIPTPTSLPAVIGVKNYPSKELDAADITWITNKGVLPVPGDLYTELYNSAEQNIILNAKAFTKQAVIDITKLEAEADQAVKVAKDSYDNAQVESKKTADAAAGETQAKNAFDDAVAAANKLKHEKTLADTARVEADVATVFNDAEDARKDAEDAMNRVKGYHKTANDKAIEAGAGLKIALAAVESISQEFSKLDLEINKATEAAAKAKEAADKAIVHHTHAVAELVHTNDATPGAIAAETAKNNAQAEATKAAAEQTKATAAKARVLAAMGAGTITLLGPNGVSAELVKAQAAATAAGGFQTTTETEHGHAKAGLDAARLAVTTLGAEILKFDAEILTATQAAKRAKEAADLAAIHQRDAAALAALVLSAGPGSIAAGTASGLAQGAVVQADTAKQEAENAKAAAIAANTLLGAQAQLIIAQARATGAGGFQTTAENERDNAKAGLDLALAEKAKIDAEIRLVTLGINNVKTLALQVRNAADLAKAYHDAAVIAVGVTIDAAVGAKEADEARIRAENAVTDADLAKQAAERAETHLANRLAAVAMPPVGQGPVDIAEVTALLDPVAGVPAIVVAATGFLTAAQNECALALAGRNKAESAVRIANQRAAAERLKQSALSPTVLSHPTPSPTVVAAFQAQPAPVRQQLAASSRKNMGW